MRLDHKVAVVTGAANGIGRACAQALAEHGALVVLADRDAEANCAAAAQISAATGQRALALACDVSVDAELKGMVDAALREFGQIDVLINNAGIIRTGSILNLDPADFDRVLNVNLRSYFVLTQLVARHMVQNKIAGSIINMSSVNSVLAIPDQVAYVTSKGGVQQLTKVCALGLAEHGIRVNAIGPGSILTDVLKVVMNNNEARNKILARTPLRRLGEPAEIASVAVFLASHYASYITGQTIFPDGGRSALNYSVPVGDVPC